MLRLRIGTQSLVLGLAAALALGCAAWLKARIEDAREAAREVQCLSDLKYFGLVLLNYHDSHGCLPSAASLGSDDSSPESWRVTLFREWNKVGLDRLYHSSVPWSHPTNAKLAAYDTTACFYWCPSGDGRRTKATDYVAVVGPHTAWPEGRCRSLGEITDDPSQTILLAEVEGSGIHWAEPKDLTLDQLLARGGTSHHRRHFNVVFADGSVGRIRKDVDRETLKALFTIDGGEPIDPQAWRLR